MTADRPCESLAGSVTVTLATFMELLDTSIANVALPIHRRRPGTKLRRSDLDTDDISGCQRRGAADVGVAEPRLRPEELLSGMRRAVHVDVAVLRLAPTLGIMLSSRVLQGIAGGGLAPVAQADPGRYIPAGQTSLGIRALHHRHRNRAGHRPGTGRLDHRQLQLALDFLHQYSHRHCCLCF